MKTNRSKALRNLLLSLVILYMLPIRSIRAVGEYLFKTPPTIQKLEFLLHTKPADAGIFLLAVILVIIAFVSLLGILGAAGGRSVSAAPKRTVKRSVSRAASEMGKRTPSWKVAADEEDVLHCDHKRGAEKYLEQIDGYLKTGLIDKDEYRVLRERYMKLNIPDDYH